jgi:transcription elongation factor Elf1
MSPCELKAQTVGELCSLSLLLEGERRKKEKKVIKNQTWFLLQRNLQCPGCLERSSLSVKRMARTPTCNATAALGCE